MGNDEDQAFIVRENESSQEWRVEVVILKERSNGENKRYLKEEVYVVPRGFISKIQFIVAGCIGVGIHACPP